MNSEWLLWAQRLQAIAQNGLTFSRDPYDIERYQQVRQIAAEMVSANSSLELPLVSSLFEGESGYATPKVDVRAAVFRPQDGALLLVKENEDGLWSLPGGWADPGDAPSQAAVREVLEETGYQTRAVKLLAVYDRSHPRHNHPPYLYYVYKFIFQCELMSEEVAEGNQAEMSEVGFFSLEQITSLPLSSTRITHSQIKRLFEQYQNPSLPTDFD